MHYYYYCHGKTVYPGPEPLPSYLLCEVFWINPMINGRFGPLGSRRGSCSCIRPTPDRSLLAGKHNPDVRVHGRDLLAGINYLVINVVPGWQRDDNGQQ